MTEASISRILKLPYIIRLPVQFKLIAIMCMTGSDSLAILKSRIPQCVVFYDITSIQKSGCLVCGDSLANVGWHT